MDVRYNLNALRYKDVQDKPLPASHRRIISPILITSLHLAGEHAAGNPTMLVGLGAFSILAWLVLPYLMIKSHERLVDLQRREKEYDGLRVMFDHLAKATKEAFWYLYYTPGRMAYFNPSMEKMWDITAEEFAANPRLIYERIHPDDRERVRVKLMDSVKSDVLEAFKEVFRIIRKDGTVRWIQSEATAARTDPQHLAWAAGTMEDITDQVILRDSLSSKVAELRTSEQRYRSLFEDAPIPLWQKDLSAVKSAINELKRAGVKDLTAYLNLNPEEFRRFSSLGELFAVNKATLELFCVSSRQDFDRVLKTLFDTEPHRAYMASLQSMCDGKRSFEIETSTTTADGRKKLVLLTWRVVPGSEADYSRVLFSASDITQIKEAQDKLEKSEELFQAFMKNLPAAAWIKDHDLRFRFVNEFYRTAMNPGQDVLGKNGSEIWPPDIAEKVRQDDTIVQSRLEPAHMLMTLRLPDERIVHHAVTKFPIPDPDGGVSVGGFGIDVSEQYEAKEELERSREMYKELVESINELVFSLDEGGFLTYISSFSSKSFGLAAEEILGPHYSFLVYPEDLLRVSTMFRQAKEGRSTSFECRFVVGDGPVRWGAVHMKPIFHGPSFAGIKGVILEITERKEAELRAVHLSSQLRALASKLESAREQERVLIAREIHDELGQKLTRLKIGLSLVRNGMKTKRPHAKTTEDVKELTRSLDLVDDVMQDIHRIATELRPEGLEELGLTEAIKTSVGEYNREGRIKCRFHTTKQRIMIDTNKSTALFRIFQEAMTNIVKHAHATEANIHLCRYKKKVKLTISDNGTGVSEKEISRTKGLGIIGMKERVLSLEGSFSISDRKPRGTTIRVEIDV